MMSKNCKSTEYQANERAAFMLVANINLDGMRDISRARALIQ